MPSLVQDQKRQSVLDFNRKAMDFFGLWPIDPQSTKGGRLWRRFIPILILCHLAVDMFVEAMSIKQAWGDTYLTVEFTIILIFLIHTTVKFITLYWHHASVQRVLARVDQLNVDLVGVSRRNVAILRNTDIISNFVYKYPPAAIIGGIAACMCVLVPHCLSKREILFMMWFPYDTTISPSLEITLVVVTFGVFLDVVTISLCDMCLTIPVLQLAGQLQMLSSNIENAKLIVESNLKSRSHRLCAGFPRVVKAQEGSTLKVVVVASMKHGENVDKYLGHLVEKTDVEVRVDGSKRIEGKVSKKRCDMQSERLALKMKEVIMTRKMNEIMAVNVNHHQQIIKLIQEMQSIFNALLAEQIIFNGLLGLAGLYVSTLAKISNPKILLVITCIMAGLIEFFFICLCCDRLTIASMQLFNSAYECDWLEASESFKRSLRLLMTRAQKHLAIKAAGVPLSRRTFRSVCKGAYYFQSLLNKIYTTT